MIRWMKKLVFYYFVCRAVIFFLGLFVHTLSPININPTEFLQAGREVIFQSQMEHLRSMGKNTERFEQFHNQNKPK